MRKPISPRMHGMIDYGTVAAVALAPRLLGFPERAERVAHGLAAGYLGLSLFTDYPAALRRDIPFRAHGAAEGIVGGLLPALPWIFGFARHRRARAFFIGLAVTTGAVALLTDWQKKPRGGPGFGPRIVRRVKQQQIPRSVKKATRRVRRRVEDLVR